MSLAYLIKYNYITIKEAEKLKEQEIRNLNTYGMADLIKDGRLDLKTVKKLTELERKRLHIYGMLQFNHELITLEEAMKLSVVATENLYNLEIISLINEGLVTLEIAISLSKEQIEILSSPVLAFLMRLKVITWQDTINLTKKDIDLLIIGKKRHNIINEYFVNTYVADIEERSFHRVLMSFKKQLGKLRFLEFHEHNFFKMKLSLLSLLNYRIVDCINEGIFIFKKEDNLELTEEQQKKLCSFRLLDWITVVEFFVNSNIISHQDALNLSEQQVKNLIFLWNSGVFYKRKMTLQTVLNLTNEQYKSAFIELKASEIETSFHPQWPNLIMFGLISNKDVELSKYKHEDGEGYFNFIEHSLWLAKWQIVLLTGQNLITQITHGVLTSQEAVKLLQQQSETVLYLMRIKLLNWQHVMSLSEHNKQILETKVSRALSSGNLLHAKEIVKNFLEDLNLEVKIEPLMSLGISEKTEKNQQKRLLDKLIELNYIKKEEVHRLNEDQKSKLNTFKHIYDLITTECLKLEEFLLLTQDQHKKLLNYYLKNKKNITVEKKDIIRREIVALLQIEEEPLSSPLHKKPRVNF